MIRKKTNLTNNMSMLKVLALIFIPTLAFTTTYIILGLAQQAIPSIVLFSLLAIITLFLFQLVVVLLVTKKEFGNISFKSVFAYNEKMSIWKIVLYGIVLFAFTGLLSITVTPLENLIFASLNERLMSIIPEYFNWNNIVQLKAYSQGILVFTCIIYFILNVLVGPIVEEMFFRGYLTNKISRFGNFAPLIITILFSLYHLWLPFNNIFRICAFFPAAFVAWKKKNIYITIVFHALCNLVSTISFIVSVFS